MTSILYLTLSKNSLQSLSVVVEPGSIEPGVILLSPLALLFLFIRLATEQPHQEQAKKHYLHFYFKLNVPTGIAVAVMILV